MRFLEKIIINQLKEDISKIFSPLQQENLLRITGKRLGNNSYIDPSIYDIVFYTLAHKSRIDIEFQNNLLNIKLKYYKRNLALLEIFSYRQHPNNNISLIFKIIRENLKLEHISKEIDIYHWYIAYRRRLTKRLVQQIFR